MRRRRMMIRIRRRMMMIASTMRTHRACVPHKMVRCVGGGRRCLACLYALTDPLARPLMDEVTTMAGRPCHQRSCDVVSVPVLAVSRVAEFQKNIVKFGHFFKIFKSVRIDAVTVADVKATADKVINDQDHVLSAVGCVRGPDRGMNLIVAGSGVGRGGSLLCDGCFHRVWCLLSSLIR
jgi:hypothetical protein